MRFAVLLSVCVSLATTTLSDGAEFSRGRDLPAVKLGATDLDAILLKTRALIDAANGLEKDLRRYSTAAGGVKFRRVAGVCFSMLFLTSLMIGSAYCWNNRNCRALGMPICSAIGFLLVLLVPWNRFLPGFVLYQRYSPFFLIRHAVQVLLLAVLVMFTGIPPSVAIESLTDRCKHMSALFARRRVCLIFLPGGRCPGHDLRQVLIPQCLQITPIPRDFLGVLAVKN